MRLRMEAGHTQKSFAESIDMHPQQYRAYENGIRYPRNDQRIRIADGLGFDVELWEEYANEK